MKLLLNRAAIIFVILFLAFPASAGDLYRWIDEDGVFHYSDIPPSDPKQRFEDIQSKRQKPDITSTQPKKMSGNTITIDIYKDFKYMNQGMPFGLSTGQTRAVSMVDQPHKQLIKEPVYASDDVRFGYVHLGNGPDNRYTYAVDGIGTPDLILYFDTNNNGDLTDDGPPYTNQGTGTFSSSVTLALTIITAKGKTVHQPYKIWFWLQDVGAGQYIPHFYAQSHFRGQITLNGYSFTAIAFETDKHDGLFRESGICIDLDNNEKCGTSEHYFHGEYVKAGQNTYELFLDYP
jgi:hypothetical protein